MSESQIKDEEAVLSALERAKADAKANREALEVAKTELDSLREQVKKHTNDIKETRIRRYITDQGADPERVLRYMNVDDLNLTPEGIEGFDTEFNRVKNDLPELFDPKRRVGGAVEMHPDSDANYVKSTSQMQAEKLMRHS